MLTEKLSAIIRLLAAIGNSLARTASEVGRALRSRSGAGLLALLREGSPLESLIDSTLTLVFWVLVLSPFLVVPLLYLLMSFAR